MHMKNWIKKYRPRSLESWEQLHLSKHKTMGISSHFGRQIKLGHKSTKE